ncbi:uncharacterized membrane protein (DUF2068 family) [Neisseria perflava]|uniref:DUF2127 domain-containing protein n=1 Tax=Neisseria perflava TaxID=33053 RepID=UPI0020A01047|nr:DUF2127 domain-containing protein [Neisseria perflava]MCP1772013.1 uncharacterized membrane protein (DUF2068 family) [Neisseria perflava]
MPNPARYADVTIKAVAVYESAKGVLALLVALAVWHYQGDLPQLTAWLTHDWHHLFGSFLSQKINCLPALGQEAAHDIPLVMVLLAVYALLRFGEGYGLYFSRAWAYWLSLLSYGLFIPYEFYTLCKTFNGIHLLVFGLNLLIMWVVYRSMRDKF